MSQLVSLARIVVPVCCSSRKFSPKYCEDKNYFKMSELEVGSVYEQYFMLETPTYPVAISVGIPVTDFPSSLLVWCIPVL